MPRSRARVDDWLMDLGFSGGKACGGLRALLTVLPKQLRVEVAFCGQLANADELHHNRHAGYYAAQLNICKIAQVDADLFGQLPAGHFHRFTRLLNICSEGFKSRAIFHIRHITSPYHILLFIECAGNDVICALGSFYNSYIRICFSSAKKL